MSEETFPIREKPFKGRDAKDINRGHKSNAGRREGSEPALEASRAKTKRGGKESQSKVRGFMREFRAQIGLGSTLEGQQSGLIYNRGYRKLQVVI